MLSEISNVAKAISIIRTRCQWRMNPQLCSFWQAIRIETDKSLCQRFDWRQGQMHSWRRYGFQAERVSLRWQNGYVKHFCLFYRFRHLVSLSILQWQMFAIRRQIYVECCIMQTSAVMSQEISCRKWTLKRAVLYKLCFAFNKLFGHFDSLFVACSLTFPPSHNENNGLLKSSRMFFLDFQTFLDLNLPINWCYIKVAMVLFSNKLCVKYSSWRCL